jgi:hypothetical protein
MIAPCDGTSVNPRQGGGKGERERGLICQTQTPSPRRICILSKQLDHIATTAAVQVKPLNVPYWKGFALCSLVRVLDFLS